MKRRLITSIFLALAVAVTSSVVLTGCAGKSYYYKQENGAWTVMGEIPDTNEGFEVSSTSSASTEESKEEESKEEESKEEESKTEESKTEESKEEESKEEESKEEESKTETPATDADTLATIKFEKPDDWSNNVSARVFDSESNTLTLEGTADGNTIVFVIPKKGDQGNEFVSPKIMFQCSLAGTVIETDEAEINGDKTYTAGEKIARGKFAIVEK